MVTETQERITDPERLSRLEGAYGHLATNAGLAAVEMRVTERIAASEIRMTERMAKMIAESEVRMTERIAEKIAESEARTAKIIAESEIRTTEKIAASEIRLMAKIAESESRLIKWGIGVVASAFAALASIMVAGFAFLYRLIAALG